MNKSSIEKLLTESYPELAGIVLTNFISKKHGIYDSKGEIYLKWLQNLFETRLTNMSDFYNDSEKVFMKKQYKTAIQTLKVIPAQDIYYWSAEFIDSNNLKQRISGWAIQNKIILVSIPSYE